MQDMLAQIQLLNSETSDRQVDPDADALRLTTVHQAKGLEFGVVFILGLADGMFPLRRAIESNDLEEERRLFYVAVTRAGERRHRRHRLRRADRRSVHRARQPEPPGP
jgi:DNA helicase-2/ATP-dependent DNA helicase PcrA